MECCCDSLRRVSTGMGKCWGQMRNLARQHHGACTVADNVCFIALHRSEVWQTNEEHFRRTASGLTIVHVKCSFRRDQRRWRTNSPSRHTKRSARLSVQSHQVWLHTLAFITLMHNCVGATSEERLDERDTIQAAMGCLAQLGKEINFTTIDWWIVFLMQDYTYGGDEVQEHAQEIANTHRKLQ